jgi:hypothetical protein
MRDDLEDVLDLYGGMPPDGQQHWRERSLPSVEFQSDAERDEFLAALRQRDRTPEAPQSVPAGPGPSSPSPPQNFQPGQRVKADLSGLTAGGVQFSQNVEAAYATIDRRLDGEPPRYRLNLLISFHGVTQIDVPAERLKAM